MEDFDSYVLASPKKENSTVYKNNDEFKTIDSKFRSAQKINKKKLLQRSFKQEPNLLLESIDSKAHCKIRVNQDSEKIKNSILIRRRLKENKSKSGEYYPHNKSASKTNKKIHPRAMDAKSKRLIKKHKDTFTFGAPTKYWKLQNNINLLLEQMSDSKLSSKGSYCTENQ